jgi:hypothetical protein
LNLRAAYFGQYRTRQFRGWNFTRWDEFSASGNRTLEGMKVTQLASGLLVIAFAAAMMGIGQLYIENRSAKFSVFPAAQAKSEAVGLSRSQRLR